MALKALLTLLFILTSVSASTLHSSPIPLAPIYASDNQTRDILDYSYIVMLQDDIEHDTFSSHMSFVAVMNELNPLQTEGEAGSSGVDHVYDSVVAKGYSGKFSENVVDMIRTRPEVKYVEQDTKIRLHSAMNEVDDHEAHSYGYAIQQKPPWVCI